MNYLRVQSQMAGVGIKEWIPVTAKEVLVQVRYNNQAEKNQTGQDRSQNQLSTGLCQEQNALFWNKRLLQLKLHLFRFKDSPDSKKNSDWQ